MISLLSKSLSRVFSSTHFPSLELETPSPKPQDHPVFRSELNLLANVLNNLPLPHLLFRRRQWHPTPVLLPGKSHGPRSLVGCSPWGHEESDMTERLYFHFSFSEEKEMATHFSVLPCRIPGTGEPGGLPSMGSHRVGHDCSALAAAAASRI